MPLCKERSNGIGSRLAAAGEGSGRIEIVLLKVKRLEAEIAFYAAFQIASSSRDSRPVHRDDIGALCLGTASTC